MVSDDRSLPAGLQTNSMNPLGEAEPTLSDAVESQRDQVSVQVTQTIQYEYDPYYEDFHEGYSDGDEDAKTIGKVAREIIGGNMKGLSMNVGDGAALEAIGTLCAEFAEAMADKVKYRYLLTNRGGNAQKLVNIFKCSSTIRFSIKV
ncbi:hypothetical protein BDQ17DRAFT_1330325 [Cyathus striatus]|nr:hypothetical protein BDQ17DRAFT_1330325 [Cyathus striatus]